MFKRRFTPFCLVAIILMLGACATGPPATTEQPTPARVAVNTLETAETLYDSTMLACADLYNQGFISPMDMEGIVDAGRKFKVGWVLAQQALITYKEIDSAGNEQQLDVAVKEVSSLLATLTELARPFLLHQLE